MFKILSPKEINNEEELRIRNDSRKAYDIAKITDEVIKEKTQAEEDFKKMLIEQRELYAKEYNEQIALKNKLEEEIRSLEKRRENALKPRLIKAKDLQLQQEELFNQKLDLEKKEKELEDSSRALMQKLDVVSDREMKVNDKEKTVKRILEGAEFQKNEVAREVKKFSFVLQDFQKQKDQYEIDMAYKMSEINAKEISLKEKERSFISRENEIQASMRLLADQRLLLDKGFEELRRERKNVKLS